METKQENIIIGENGTVVATPRKKEPGKVVIKAENVSMRFNLSPENTDSLKEYVIKTLQRKKPKRFEEFWALKDVNFELRQGERLGVLGLNGAGKSTLLKAIAGVYKPTSGKITRKGVIAPLLELGAGFEKDYSARENIFLYGSVLGYSEAFLKEKFDEIIEFSELEKFVDVPIKNYSSGMKSRLGFAICTAVNPDILILDEVLSVGDRKFRKKSEKRVMRLIEKGVTVIFVSHSLDQVRRICDKAMILDHGTVISFGDVDTVSNEYESMTE